MKPSDYQGRTQHASNLRHPRRVLPIVLACLVSACLFFLTAFSLVAHDLGGQLKQADKANALLSRTSQPDDNYSGRALNILMIGSDSRSDGNDAASLTNNDDTTQRSDTTMVVHISADRSRVQVVSLPRDMMVRIPDCTRSDGTVVPGKAKGQFNSAFSYGGGDRDDVDAAMACTWKTVEDFSGLKIDEAIIVDFNGFISMINALGGINVYVANEISDARNTGLVSDVGCKHFDGTQALQYARVRHGVKGGDGSDIQRINRQQEVMGIMMRTAMKKNLFTSLNQLYGFVRSGLNSLTVSSGLSSMTTLSGLAWSLRGLQTENLIFLSVPVTEYPADRNRLQIYDQQADVLWAALKNDQPIPAGFSVRNGKGDTYVVPESTASSSESASSDAAESSASSSSSNTATNSTDGQASVSTVAPTVNSTNTTMSENDEERAKIAQLQAECEAQ